jgi:hypothetical protein
MSELQEEQAPVSITKNSQKLIVYLIVGGLITAAGVF